jgi:tRNA U54 and U55 pseudouridine synthase Pus10
MPKYTNVDTAELKDKYQEDITVLVNDIQTLKNELKKKVKAHAEANQKMQALLQVEMELGIAEPPPT